VEPGRYGGCMTREVEPRWKTKTKKKSRATEDEKWRKAVCKRDGWRCQWPGCWVRDKSIEAHHIATRKQRPDLIHVVANGVALCWRHHARAHDRQDEGEALGFVSHERYELARKEAQ